MRATKEALTSHRCCFHLLKRLLLFLAALLGSAEAELLLPLHPADEHS